MSSKTSTRQPGEDRPVTLGTSKHNKRPAGRFLEEERQNFLALILDA
jgi:hypothetical protein